MKYKEIIQQKITSLATPTVLGLLIEVLLYLQWVSKYFWPAANHYFKKIRNFSIILQSVTFHLYSKLHSPAHDGVPALKLIAPLITAPFPRSLVTSH